MRHYLELRRVRTGDGVDGDTGLEGRGGLEGVEDVLCSLVHRLEALRLTVCIVHLQEHFRPVRDKNNTSPSQSNVFF